MEMMEMAMDSGHVRVYGFENGTWTQLGGDIDGDVWRVIESGLSISLSDDGTVLAVGAHRNDGNDSVRRRTSTCLHLPTRCNNLGTTGQ